MLTPVILVPPHPHSGLWITDLDSNKTITLTNTSAYYVILHVKSHIIYHITYSCQSIMIGELNMAPRKSRVSSVCVTDGDRKWLWGSSRQSYQFWKQGNSGALVGNRPASLHWQQARWAQHLHTAQILDRVAPSRRQQISLTLLFPRKHFHQTVIS